MTTSRCTYSARVAWVDTDAAGVYHHTSVARFAESAEAELIRRLGLSEYFPSARRVHYEVDLEGPLRFGDEVATTIEVDYLGRSSLRWRFELQGAAGRVAHGSYVVVHVDGGGSSMPWPEAWRARLLPAGPPPTPARHDDPDGRHQPPPGAAGSPAHPDDAR